MNSSQEPLDAPQEMNQVPVTLLEFLRNQTEYLQMDEVTIKSYGGNK